MRYILQIYTGSLAHCACIAAQATARVARCLERLDVTDVIYGWTAQRAVHDALSELLVRRRVRQHLWLPVFSEIQRADAMPFVRADGRADSGLAACAGEDFRFVCPSAPENLAAALDAFSVLAADLPLDGVFIDRIRYPSAAHGFSALLGCQCARCQASYQAAGVDVARILAMPPDALMPTALDERRYRFASQDAEALLAVKCAIITQAVQRLCAHFHAKGLAVGLDAFAPLLAAFVGQDVCALGKLVDYIKPMMYRRTHAPAGLPFEVDALARAVGGAVGGRLAELWGGDALSDAVNVRQMARLQAACGHVYPGIEINPIADICHSTPSYVRESIAQAQAAGCARVVLSWDVLQMPDDMLAALASSA